MTVNVLAMLTNLLIVSVSAHVSQRLRRNPHIGTLLQKAMGVMFIGRGARLATEKA